MSAFKRRYAGIPYVDGGRSDDGADCWGLVRLVYDDEASIALPCHSEISSKDLRAIARAIDRERCGEVWRKVDRGDLLQVLDLVVMTAPGGKVPIHLGVYGVRNGVGQVLHTEIETDAAWTRLDHPALSGRLLGFWRHRDLDKGAR